MTIILFETNLDITYCIKEIEKSSKEHGVSMEIIRKVTCGLVISLDGERKKVEEVEYRMATISKYHYEHKPHTRTQL